LIDEKNEDLILVVMDKVKNKIGYEPTEEQVLNFLKNLKTETRGHLKEVISPPTLESIPTFLNKQSKGQPKAPPKRLAVTMSDGEVIRYHRAMDTFREVIFKLGPEKVLRVDRERMLIATESIPKRRTVPYGGYYITGNHGTPAKRDLLERIAERLRVQLRIDLVD
jgi:hypothetical protein